MDVNTDELSVPQDLVDGRKRIAENVSAHTIFAIQVLCLLSVRPLASNSLFFHKGFPNKITLQ